MRAFAVMSADVESGALLLTLRGPLTMPAVAASWFALQRCLAHFPRAVVVDLSDVVMVGAVAATLLPVVLRRGARLPGVSVLAHGATPRLAGRLAAGRHGPRVLPARAQAVAAAGALPDVPGVRRTHARLAAAPQAPGRARELVDGACRSWGLEHVVDDAKLIVSELVSNAVEHAGTDIDVTVRCHRGLLRLGVADRSAVAPVPATRDGDGPAVAGPVALRGRGLPMVASQSRAWGVIPAPGGKIVWAALPTARG
ncbi:ATP-binding protein [Polymorphospora sp. NPDC051019]|uniref:ATP-binding protein n=1 Tax=Polymorphospora sp. NPDC051019 TaxID=3155725 RepID=UPI00342AD47D